MQSRDQMQQRGLAAAGGANDAQELAGFDFEVDVVERKQAFAALRAIAQADVAQPNFGDSREIRVRAMSDGNRTNLSTRIGGPSRESRIGGNWKLRGEPLYIGAHWIAFRPFSARTWLRSVRSYRRERSGICRPRKPSANACCAAVFSALCSGS